MRRANKNLQLNNVASEELPQTSPTEIRRQNPPYGAHIFDSVMDKHGLSQSCRIP